MVRMCLDGKFIEAQPLHYSMVEITNLFFAEGNPGGVKSALKLLDICGDQLRLPLVNVSPETKELIKSEIQKLNLI